MLSAIRSSLIKNKTLLVNAIAFQVVWFICVQGHNLLALLAAIVLLFIYKLTVNPSLKTWQALLTFSLIGYLGDGIIAMLFNVNYSATSDPLLSPIWLLALWLAFSTTLNHSMSWLFTSYYLTISIALLMVPLSYLAGITLSGSSLTHATGSILYWLFFISEGLWWAILLLSYQKFNSSKKVKHD